MAPKNKPIFLKTFSELTIQELRSLPVSQILSLFFQEVTATFTTTPVVKVKKARPAKKKVTKHILTARIKPPKVKPFASFRITLPYQKIQNIQVTELLKRIFVVEPYTYAAEPQEMIEKTVREVVTIREEKRRKSRKTTEEKTEFTHSSESLTHQDAATSETIVFSKTSL